MTIGNREQLGIEQALDGVTVEADPTLIGRPRAVGSMIIDSLKHLAGREVIATTAALVSALALAGGTANASGEKGASSRAEAARVDGQDTIKCTIGNIVIAGGFIKPEKKTSGCKIGNVLTDKKGRPKFVAYASVPEKNLTWRWTETSRDFVGECTVSGYSGSGAGDKFSTPKAPANVVEKPIGGAMPPILRANFELSASYQGLKGNATRKRVFSKADSLVLCAPQPLLVSSPNTAVSMSSDGSSVSVITGLTISKPKLITSLYTLKGGGIASEAIYTPSGDKCNYVSEAADVQSGYLLANKKSIRCESGITGTTYTYMIYRGDDGLQCETDLKGAGSYHYPMETYGPGKMFVGTGIISRDPTGKQADYQEGFNYFSDGWTTLDGLGTPCDDKHAGWSVGHTATN
ncbi:hypothetical protein HYW35_03380 [Candidatus Saccharibacteria bacterium]|nr:hypothetical protein [Candidatus Saccharibacteria bacterium]